MPYTSASSHAATAAASWSPFWVELPILVVCAALVLIALVALARARREDVPKLFADFCAFLSQVLRTLPSPEKARPEQGAPLSDPQQLDSVTAIGDDEARTIGRTTGNA